MRLAPVPLLLAKTAQPYRRPVLLAAVDPTREFAIPQTVRETRAAIVILGAIFRSGLKRFFIGNTAGGCSTHAAVRPVDCEVHVLHKSRAARTPRGPGEGDTGCTLREYRPRLGQAPS